VIAVTVTNIIHSSIMIDGIAGFKLRDRSLPIDSITTGDKIIVSIVN
jgi:hypothetical protein